MWSSVRTGTLLQQPLLGRYLLGRFSEIADGRFADIGQIFDGVLANAGRLLGRFERLLRRLLCGLLSLQRKLEANSIAEIIALKS